MQNITVTGNLGKDAILKDIEGDKVLNFSLACNDDYVNKGGTKVEKTTWFDCALWGSEKLGPYLKSGATVSVIGTIALRTWNNTDTGKAEGALKLTVRHLQLCDKKPKTTKETAATDGAGTQAA